MADVIYNSFFRDLSNGSIDLDTDTFKLMLVTSSYTANSDTHAKQNAPWTDRTGNARSGIFGTAERDVAQRIVTIYLSHGATLDYGQYLELSNGGRYAVIMRTIEGHLPALNAMLRDALG